MCPSNNKMTPSLNIGAKPLFETYHVPTHTPFTKGARLIMEHFKGGLDFIGRREGLRLPSAFIKRCDVPAHIIFSCGFG